MRVALARLAGAIEDAEKQRTHAGHNGTTMMQVRASERIDDLMYAFAIASGTAINGMHFKGLLEQARKDYHEATKA